MRVLKRITIVLCGILVIVLILAGVVRALVSMQMISVKQIVFTIGTPLPHDDGGRTNILLLGVGDEDHAGVDLTDSIMVASIDPATRSTAMVSVPRDLWITQKNHHNRINTLYREIRSKIRLEQDLTVEQASPLALKETADAIGDLLGLQIHGVVKIDFSGLVEAVDQIGGVEVDVPYDIVDTTYPGAEVDTYQTFRISQGLHVIDGETALKYARSRHTTSDFGRSARQQQLLMAMAQKVKRERLFTSPGTIMSLWNILGEHVETTFSAREIIRLVEEGMRMDHKTIASYQLQETSLAPGAFLYTPPREQFAGAAVLLPEGGAKGFEQIRAFVDIAVEERWPLLHTVELRLINAGAPTGAAGNLGSDFKRFGFTVGSIENIPGGKAAAIDRSFLTSTAENQEVERFFAHLLQLPARKAQAPTATGSALGSNVDQNVVTITLGTDYVPTPLSSLLTRSAASTTPR